MSMNKYERQRQIIRLVRARGSDTIKNLAMEFEVSERTISRDIEELSLTRPIYTKSGRYGGGVYILPYTEDYKKIF